MTDPARSAFGATAYRTSILCHGRAIAVVMLVRKKKWGNRSHPTETKLGNRHRDEKDGTRGHDRPTNSNRKRPSSPGAEEAGTSHGRTTQAPRIRDTGDSTSTNSERVDRSESRERRHSENQIKDRTRTGQPRPPHGDN